MNDFLKRGLLMSTMCSVGIVAVYLLISFILGGYVNIKNTVIAFIVMFAGSMIYFYAASYSFGDMNIEEDCDDEADNSIDFYNAYSNGVSRVERIVFVDKKTQTSTVSYVDIKGDYITNEWFDAGSDFTENTAVVYRDSKYALMNKEGKIVTDWFAMMAEFENGMAKVMNDEGMINFVLEDGNLLWKEWKNGK